MQTTGKRLLNAGPWRFMYFPPDENRLRDQAERLMDRKGVPPKRPGDEYTVAGALVGIVGGIVVAVISGGMPWVYIVGAIGGGIAGTLLGSLAATFITKYRNSKDNPKHY